MKRNKPVGLCSVEGCERAAKTKGLCQKHYARQWKYGRTHLVNTGEKRKHPHYILWFERKRAGVLCEKWLDFWAFAHAIGDKPDGPHFLVRTDGSRPYGPDNFSWIAHLKRRSGESRKDWLARKWAARQAANPGMERRRTLKRRYGLTDENYRQMAEAQDNRCAICLQPETAIDPKVGSIRRLAVDHCHSTQRVRGLLCFRCNSTIGRIGEDVALVDAIRAYLICHAEPGANTS